jgi:hypothetical protein
MRKSVLGVLAVGLITLSSCGLFIGHGESVELTGDNAKYALRLSLSYDLTRNNENAISAAIYTINIGGYNDYLYVNAEVTVKITYDVVDYSGNFKKESFLKDVSLDAYGGAIYKDSITGTFFSFKNLKADFYAASGKVVRG